MSKRKINPNIPKSKFRGVDYFKTSKDNQEHWLMQISRYGLKAFKLFPFTPEGERKAAIAYDLKRIEFGLEPVNVLKKRG